MLSVGRKRLFVLEAVARSGFDDMGSIPQHTPDGRYLIVNERLWRSANPALPEVERRALVAELMNARRAVKVAMKASDAVAETEARARVHAAKTKLGERGPVWWDDGAPDLNRHLVKNTPYWDWYRKIR